MVDFVTKTSSGSHTHTIDNHTHWNPDHEHTIDITHSHEEIWGIYEQDTASNLSLYINGTKIAQNLNGDNEIDIKDYIIKGQWNEIRIESATNGRVSYNLFMKSFNLF
jgi:hypothetical protein